MDGVEADFSRRELKNFLNELGDQVDMGRVEIHIPGVPDGDINVVLDQPIDVVFDRDEDGLEIKIKLDDKREMD